jgi:predicted nucleic acid-binding protein
VVAWFVDVNAGDLFLSVVTIGEIELGISHQQHLNPVFAQQLADWLDLTLRAYGERILPLTVGIARAQLRLREVTAGLKFLDENGGGPGVRLRKPLRQNR